MSEAMQAFYTTQLLCPGTPCKMSLLSLRAVINIKFHDAVQRETLSMRIHMMGLANAPETLL
jgi:hypothetical protein